MPAPSWWSGPASYILRFDTVRCSWLKPRPLTAEAASPQGAIFGMRLMGHLHDDLWPHPHPGPRPACVHTTTPAGVDVTAAWYSWRRDKHLLPERRRYAAPMGDPRTL